MAKQNSCINATGSLTVDPGASGDSFVQFDINGTGEFRIGVDDDASDAFKISQGSALGTNDTFVMTASGERTMPLHPAFLVRENSPVNNVTGDGTAYTIVYDTEVFDQSGDMTTTTFTAPVTGRYYLTYQSGLNNVTSSHTDMVMTITTSNRTYTATQDPYAVRVTGAVTSFKNTDVIADMDSGDTATSRITVSGSGKTVDIYEFSYSTFSGVLIA